MSISKRNRFRKYSAYLMLAILPAVADAEKTHRPDWTCQTCLSAVGWELDIKGGPAYVNNDAYRFGDYSGLGEKGIYLFTDVSGRYWRKDASYMNFEGYTSSSDSAALFIEGGKQSVYKLRASYQALPRRIFNSTVTPYGGNGSSKLALPSNWVRASTTQQMTTLDSTAEPVAIQSDLDVFRFGFDLTPTQHWKIRTDYTRRENEGKNRSSGSFLFSAVEFTSPVDHVTDDIEVALTYSADWWQSSLTYFGSIFRNEDKNLTWDNPYTAATGVDSGQLALLPDNESHQVSLTGSMLLPARTTLNGQLSFGRMTQNEKLLPYTTNSLLATNPLPVTSANAEVTTLNLNIRAVSSPWSKVTLEGELRYNDFDNKTPVNDYTPVTTDSLLAGTVVSNTAYDYTRRDVKLRGEYRQNSSLKYHVGFDTQRFDRNRQDRTRTTTNRLWFRLRTRTNNMVKLDIDLYTENRNGTSYNAVKNSTVPENPLMRKYNMADRERDGIKLHGSVFTGGSSDFGWEFEYGKDNYDSSDIGLTDSNYLRVGGDFTWLFGEAASAYASLYNEQITTNQRNSQTFSKPDWAGTTDDSFTTATVGVAYPDIFGPMDAVFEYTWSKAVGETRNATNGLASSYPDLGSTRQNVKLGLSYPYNESLSFAFNYLYESFTSDDWALDGVEPDTISNLLSLGANSYDYNVSIFYFSVLYQLHPY